MNKLLIRKICTTNRAARLALGRRAFIGTLSRILLAAPIAVRAQPATKVYRIGFLEAGAASVNRHFLDAFQSGLLEFGYVEGNNVVIDARWAEGRAERFPELLGELIQLKPDVIVVASTLGAVAARKAAISIPVVFESRRGESASRGVRVRTRQAFHRCFTEPRAMSTRF